MKLTKQMRVKFAGVVVGVAGFLCSMAGILRAADEAKPADYYTTDELKYQTRPDPKGESFFGIIGTTGLKARVYPGVVLKVESMMPGSPSEGKFAKDEILTGINGADLKGHDPFVAMGNALTKAEATDGKMVFDVTSADGKTQRKETVTIPVLGAYSKTWPLDCPKSKRIIDEAAAFYADPKKFNASDIPGALGCLFLLSTGDDKYLPRVKAYFDAFPKDLKAIGLSTWSNGYNGIACGEYYLRTGDKSVLPIMQHYCDDAKEYQMFGCGWSHSGSKSIHPGYCAGGIVHAAGLQVLTTLLLGKECGVNVDEQTLLGALRHEYRFAGRGSAPYGDHRGEGGLGSNGKDGMIAAAMQIAAGASGDVTIYEKARNYLTLGTIDSYSSMVMGHGDNGRGDGIWRGITTAYLMKDKPALFRESMDRLTWWHDLSREPGGSIGIATLDFSGGAVGSSGPGMGLSFTAPLRTLRITGAPKTKFSKEYTLPTKLWGTEADLAFLSLEHNPKYLEYGPEEPAHVPYWALGGAYHQPKKDIKTLPREVILKNVYHRQFMIRTQACKALRAIDAFDELEKLLEDPDPRVRRAALDGMIDYKYWFGIGDNPIPTDKFTPAMLKSITKMLSDPKEAWWVVDGALLALKLAPANEIQARLPLIIPWTKHPDWWFRDSAFHALSGLQKDDALYVKILPTLLTMATSEFHTMPREWMMQHLNAALQQKKPESDAGKLILAGLRKGVDTGKIKSGDLGVGAYNIIETLKLCLQNDPTLAPALATALQARFSDLRTGDIVGIVADPGGFTAVMEKLDSKQREELKDILFKVYRPEIIKRLKAKDYADEGHKPGMVSAIVSLTNLKEKVAVPGPDPATFASPPSTSGMLDIVMKATPGRGDFEPIEYFFDETSGNPGGADSGWTTHPVYTDTSLEPSTSYTYTVKMRNALGQEGNASLPVSVTTPAAEFTAVRIPNGGFDTIYKPGQTTITGTISGYTAGVGPATTLSSGGKFNFSDNTSGLLADVPDWIGYDRDGWIKYGGTGPWGTQNSNLQGFLSAGGMKAGGNSFSCNGANYACREGALIVSAASIGKIQGKATYVLVGYAAGSATPFVLRLLADGVEVTPTSAIDPQLVGGWQKFSRTYAPADLAKHVGKEITIVCGLGRDSKGEQTAMDELSLRYFIVP